MVADGLLLFISFYYNDNTNIQTYLHCNQFSPDDNVHTILEKRTIGFFIDHYSSRFSINKRFFTYINNGELRVRPVIPDELNCRPNYWSTYEYTYVLVYKNNNNKKIPELQCT